ncbi:MAG: hypothetical protein IH984_08690 [Planctomycetes bacterium]|nr:hypothetical protein [Planctomycetota bacterium]
MPVRQKYMRFCGLHILGVLAVAFYTKTAVAGIGVLGVSWEPVDMGWDLYANVSQDTIVLNADLGDVNIDLLPDGINAGLFSTNGIILIGSFLALGDEAIDFARILTITPSGTGSLVDASWYALNGATPEFDPETGYRVWLGRFFVEPGASLGGASGGPNSDTQSRVYIGWVDDNGIGVGVFDIPFSNVCTNVFLVDESAPPSGDGLNWASAFNNLQEALQVATACGTSGAQIWVAEGIYTPTQPNGDRTISFNLADGVAVYGGFPLGGSAFDERDPATYITILSGDLNADDDSFGDNSENSWHVLRATNIVDAQNTILDGFVISAGNANGVVNLLDDDAGGMLIQSSSLTVANCIFTNNVAESGGAIGQFAASNTNFINCLFISNHASDHSGAINCTISVLSLVNCCVSANDAPQADGVLIRGEASIANIVNSILWGNGGNFQDDQIMLLSGALPANLNINYTCVQDWTGEYGGIGNIGADPLFADPNLNDFHILAGSPTIDAADNTALPIEVVVDLDSNPRYVDDPCTVDSGNGTAPIVDMGVYEFQFTCPWDLDCNNSVGTGDLLVLFAQWGTAGPADFDESGAVGTADLLILFANWGLCP